MRRIHFSEDEVRQLKEERLRHGHPIVRRRMMALCLEAAGHRHKDICQELNISEVCLRTYLDTSIEQGIEGLRRLGCRGKRNLLDENRDIIITHRGSSPPGS